MPPPESHAAKTVRECLAQFPDAPTRTLAKKLYKEHPTLWGNFDSCCQMVRQKRGAKGQQHRDKIADKSQFKPNGAPNPFPKLPPSIKRLNPFAAFHIDTPGNWGIISDVHAPFHDEDALEVAVNVLREMKPVGIILNGDIADFYRISDHRKDPEKVDFWEEIEAVMSFLDFMRRSFPKAKLIYKHGNHEERYINWMFVKAPELLGIPKFEFRSLLELDKFKIEEVKDKRPIRLGKLWVLHGHEFRRGINAPVNPARGLFLRCHDNALQGDCHRSSHHAETQPLTRHVVSCFSAGCLCQLDADYDPLNKWNHGMAKARIEKDGAFNVTNYRIIDGGAYS